MKICFQILLDSLKNVTSVLFHVCFMVRVPPLMEVQCSRNASNNNAKYCGVEFISNNITVRAKTLTKQHRL